MAAGEKVTLRLVARYADANNISFAAGSRQFAARRRSCVQHCEEVGRDQSEIERTLNIGPVMIRDSQAEAARALQLIYDHNGGARTWSGRPASAQPAGTPEHIVELFEPFVERATATSCSAFRRRTTRRPWSG